MSDLSACAGCSSGIADGVAISAGHHHTLALLRDNTLLTWGCTTPGSSGMRPTASARARPGA
ncbi:hypothetical protein JQX13_02375 [Archangium violaceum]|uniref:RCC1-like domain-containing protein n=1 Tax=Archangium violaceum TaxID=83451 RepID=UPI00193BF04E|nr:hypothetical protein JQX13_02375 [Archangium violaceum]